MIPPETCRLLITLLVIIIGVLSTYWSYKTLNERRGFFIAYTSTDGNISKRIDVDLLKSVTIRIITLATSTFLIGILLIFVFENEWVFGLDSGKRALSIMLVYVSFGVFGDFYKSIKDQSAKRYEIREVEQKEP